jgi:hypothetical protein
MDPNPFAELPGQLVLSLEKYVYGDSDWELQNVKLDALAFLCDAWDEIQFEQSEVQAWIDAHAARDLRLKSADSGELREVDPSESVSVIVPHSLMAELATSVMEAGSDRRVVRLLALREVLNEWEQQLLDDEKLLGHMIRSHGLTQLDLIANVQVLIDRHAIAHRASD